MISIRKAKLIEQSIWLFRKKFLIYRLESDDNINFATLISKDHLITKNNKKSSIEEKK
jgi:hypothetical protein